MVKPLLVTISAVALAAVIGTGAVLVRHHLKPGAAVHVQRGDADVAATKFAEAILEYRMALQQNPKLGDVRVKLGDAYLRVNDLRDALAEYVRAADLLPNSVDPQVKAGELLILARRFEDARARADQALTVDPRNVKAQILRGNALAGLKDFDAAMTEYQDAIAIDPKQNVAYANLGTLQLAQGKREEAEATFKKAVEAEPRSVAARLALANFYWSTGRVEGAEDALKSALDIDPDNVDANRALGLFYVSTNRVAEAEKHFVALAHVMNDDRAALALADYYIIANRHDEARKILNDRASHDAVGAQATVRLASLDAIEGHRAVAESRLHELLEKQPKNVSALLLSAQVHLQDSKNDEALADAAAVVAAEPNSQAAARAWAITGRIKAMRDRTDEAINAYEQVLKLDPRPFAADVALARLYLQRRDASKATTYAQQALAISKNDPSAIDTLVRADLTAGDVTKASADLAPLQLRFKEAVGTLRLTALVQLASKQPAAARATYGRLLQANPNDGEALSGLVQIDVAAGRPKDAVTSVDARLKAAKPSPALLILAARVHHAAGDEDGAESLLQQAIQADPDRLQAYSLLGQLYASEHRLEEAKDRFRDLLTHNPKSVGTATIIGMLLEQQGRADEAERQYQQVLAIDGRAAVASNNLAWIYVAANRKLDEALQLAQTAQQALPEEPNVNDTLGWVYYRKNMAREAIAYLETAAEKQPNEPLHHFHVGMAYVQIGEWKKAREALHRALDLKPDFDGAAEARKTLDTIGA